MTFSAKEQEAALAAKVQSSPEFATWLLSRTKFKHLDAQPVLVRSDNPWYQSNKTGQQSETDILMVFELIGTKLRFALHVENKRRGDQFRPGQAQLYNERATDWVGVPKWGNYQDFECVLLAPDKFLTANKASAEFFDVCITHEALSEFVPEFAL